MTIQLDSSRGIDFEAMRQSHRASGARGRPEDMPYQKLCGKPQRVTYIDYLRMLRTI